MTRVTVELNTTYITRSSKKVVIIKETVFARLRYRGDNGVNYTKHGIADKTRGKSYDLIMTQEEADRLNDDTNTILNSVLPQEKPVSTQKVVKIKDEITYLTVNLGKRRTPFKLDINQGGKITRIEIFSDYDPPVVQS